MSFDFFVNERSVLLYHHEKFDGSGYPEGLKGDQIPLGARLFSVADSFAAMTSERDYRRTFSIDEAVLELADKAGTQFDPDMVLLFFDVLEKYEERKEADKQWAKFNKKREKNKK